MNLAEVAKCPGIDACINYMLLGRKATKWDITQFAIARILDLPKSVRGDRKAARKLNADGLRDMEAGNAQSAIYLFGAASKLDAGDVEIQTNLGFAHLKAGDGKLAHSAFKNALSIDPRRTGSWVPMAEAYDLENQKDLSVAALLLGFEYSSNKEKTLVYFSTKATAAERESMRAAYGVAMQKIEVETGMKVSP